MRTAFVVAVMAGLGACSSWQPGPMVAADDEALCRYAAGEPGSTSHRQCRDRLTGQRTRTVAANATAIDASQPNAVALLGPASQLAACREADASKCAPTTGDVTGTIPTPAPKP